MEASKKEANVLQTYEELKTEFENHACRVDDVLLYPVLNTKNERTLYTLLPTEGAVFTLKIFGGENRTQVRPRVGGRPEQESVQENGRRAEGLSSRCV